MPSRTDEKPRSWQRVFQQCPIIHWLLRINPFFFPRFLPLSIGQGRLVDVSPDSSLSWGELRARWNRGQRESFFLRGQLKKLLDKFRHKVINVPKCGFWFMHKLGITKDLETTPVKFHCQQSICSAPVWGRAGDTHEPPKSLCPAATNQVLFPLQSMRNSKLHKQYSHSASTTHREYLVDFSWKLFEIH